MKLATTIDELKQTLGTVTLAVEQSRGFPWKEGILLETSGNKMSATATNDVFVIQDVQNASVYEEGACLVNAKMFAGIVNKAKPGNVTLETKGDTMIITTKSGKYKTAIMNEKEFKADTTISGEASTLKASAEKFIELIYRVKATVSSDESRPSINGIHLKTEYCKLNAESTDGARISTAYCDIENSANIDVIIPQKSVNAIIKVCESKGIVDVVSNGKKVCLTNGNKRITTTLMTSKFVDVSKLFRSNSKTEVVIESKSLKEAIDRVMVTSEKEAVVIDVKDNEILLEATGSTSAGSEDVECIQSGDDVRITFDSKLLNGILSSAGEKVIIGFENEVTPAMITPFETEANERYKYMIAPLRPLNHAGNNR